MRRGVTKNTRASCDLFAEAKHLRTEMNTSDVGMRFSGDFDH